MVPCILADKLRLASAGVAGIMLATFIFPNVYVLADSLSTNTITASTTVPAPTPTVPSTLTDQTSTDATATNGVALTDHSTTVSAADVSTTLTHDGSVLAASDQTQTTSDSNSAIQAVTAGASVDIPKDPSQGVTLGATDGPKLDIQLPNADNAGDAKTVAPGTIAYPSTDGAASAVQATEDGGVRMLTIIDNPNAPTAYDYKVSVPDGGRIALNADGGASILDGSGDILASVAMPWAHDATGRVIDTYFTTDGITLTQHVEHNVSGVVYPVTADPWWNTAWKITKCAATLAAIVATTYFGVKYIRALGGVVMAAQLLTRAGGASDWMKVLGGTAAWVLGLKDIKENCLP